MTATERAALEALAETWRARVHGRSGAGKRSTYRACANELEALARSLSSPPPAEPPLTCVKCSFFHGRVIGDCRHTPEVRTVQPTTPACPWFIAAALPASDERPSDPPRVCAMDGLTYEEHIARGLDTDTDEHGPWRPRAAAPAPDEGRPQEKKLTHAASAPQRQSPTRVSDAGCDGKGSLNV